MREPSAKGELISKSGHGGARANSGGLREGAGRKPLRYADPPTFDLRWYVVRTGYQSELLADLELRNAGFTIFNPTLWKPATLSRRNSNGTLRTAKPARLVPLFPRYLFVQFRRADPTWRAIRGLDGVDYLFSGAQAGGIPGAPIAIPDQSVELIRSKCAPNDCIYPKGLDLNSLHAPDDAPVLAPLLIDATARVTSGLMIDWTGICQWSDAKRVGLLFEIMGRPVVVELSRAAVEAV